MGAKSTDVVIIGAGILGCTAAYELAKRGIRVVLLDAGSIGQGTSTRSFSWINATSKTNNRSYYNLNAQGLDMYLEMAKNWGADKIGVHQSGMIEWASVNDELGLKTIREDTKILTEWGYSIHALEQKSLEKLEPNVCFEKGSEGYLAEGDCWLDVPVFLNYLNFEIQAAGGEVTENCKAHELLADDNGKVKGVQTAAGQINCAKVIVATGVDTPEVLSELTGYAGFATHFPVRRAPGLLLYTPAIAPLCIHHVMYPADKNGLHIRPTGDGGLLLGADDTDGMILESQTEQAQMQAAKILLQRVQKIIPQFAGAGLLEQCRAVVGMRAMPADERSIAGPILSAEGLYILVTHSGISLAPILAKLIADCIGNNETPKQLQPFSLDRFDR